MNKLHLLKWLRNVPISRKLYFTVGIMGLLIIVELGTLTFAIKTLSSVRAYVSAEGLWSKAQKDAAYHLQKYGRSHKEADYQDYLSFLKVSQGDHKTRLELAKPEPDYAVARQGFIEGRLHPDDIDGAIKLFRRFHAVSYIDKAITVWTKGDSLLTDFVAIGTELHNEVSATNSSAEKVNEILGKLDPLNDKLTKVEDEFSFTLGEGSRWLENLILKLLFGLVLTVEVCGLSLTVYVSRNISRGLNEIIGAAEKISTGDLTVRATRYSSDEIGILATAFNEMTHKLEKNITALKNSEENLRISKKVAEESVVVKENFLANMSHEIRTPMNAVMGFTTLLENSELTADQREIVRSMKLSGQSLMTLINDILDYAKIESGKIQIEQIPFSIAKSMESLEVLLRQKAQAKNLALSFHIDPSVPAEVLGDPTRLMQILLNLTDNAVKFTEAGSVSVGVRRLQSAGDDVVAEFRVKDTGSGIPSDKFVFIFERFTQVSAETTRKHGGTGLGLSIVKSLVELQKGTITLTSEPGKGSEFTFVLAYGKAPERPVEPAAIRQAAGAIAASNLKTAGDLQILVAEDNPINQMLVQHVLKKNGLKAVIADNGRIAVEKMQEQSFDLILMDIQMPEMDGYEATVKIRTELNSDIPIIALTAHAMNQEREKCLGLGMNEFMSKPFDQKQLVETILRLCAGAPRQLA